MKDHRCVAHVALFSFLCGITLLPADVKLPAIFGDHMVLQQGAKLPVWGTADPGEKVSVTLGGESGSAVAGADGKWLVSLPPLPAGTTPLTMTVAGKNTLTFTDVLIGDVWICSGQSNMEFGLGNECHAKDEIPKANLPLVHLFLVPKKASLTPEADVSASTPPNPLQGHWVVCTPDNVIKVGGWNGFSAVGYYFGREIQQATGQPVGLIGTYWGGTPAQSWTSLEKLQSEPLLKHYADDFAKTLAAYPQAMANFPAAQAAYLSAVTKWKASDGLAPTAPIDNAAKARAAALKLPPPPQAPANPEANAWVPTSLYNGMIAPLIPYAIKGAIWYQGESNAHAAPEYATLFPAMITDWRQRWGVGDFPFLFVQLARYQEPNASFAQLRESQLKTLALPNTGMAVAFDIGDTHDIHPKDKLDVGHRLALAAQHIAYGKDVVYSGPVLGTVVYENATVHLGFKQTGSGLVIGSAPWVTPTAQPLPTTSLLGFMLAGADKKWFPADAKIDGNTVILSSAQVPQPVAVRYAFLDSVGNLYNKEGLPASPFRTDTWEVRQPPPPAPPAPPTPPAAK
jgi:sialate O-acetylesterase